MIRVYVRGGRVMAVSRPDKKRSGQETYLVEGQEYKVILQADPDKEDDVSETLSPSEREFIQERERIQ